MLTTAQIGDIIQRFQTEYPLTPLNHPTNAIKCGKFVIYNKNSVFVIATADTGEELASAIYKRQAFALVYAANAFPTLSPREQNILKLNMPPDLIRHAEIIPKKKHAGGRPKTGRRYKQYWINDEEDAAIKKLLAEMRGKQEISNLEE